MTKQLATIVVALALALCLAGCGLMPHSDPVQLLTGPPGSHSGCFAATAAGLLVVDPKYGTAIRRINNLPTMVLLPDDAPVTVAWRPGFTARRSGSEVEVLDPQGNAVAITGRNYTFFGGFVNKGGSSGIKWPELPIGVLWACGDVTQVP